MQDNYIAIIPARAGSKGIKKKNIQLIDNKPMISYTFEAAINSNFINKSFVTTDDLDVIELAKQNGINVPFVRSKDLAKDDSSTSDVILDFLNWYKKEYENYPHYFVLLQPTSPLRDSHDIDNAIQKIKTSNKKSLFSASEVTQHPYEMFHINEDNSLDFFYQPDNISSAVRRQLYKKTYFEDGAIYICETQWFLENKKFFDINSDVYILSQEHSVDVDTNIDLELVRSIIKQKGKI